MSNIEKIVVSNATFAAATDAADFTKATDVTDVVFDGIKLTANAFTFTAKAANTQTVTFKDIATAAASVVTLSGDVAQNIVLENVTGSGLTVGSGSTTVTLNVESAGTSANVLILSDNGTTSKIKTVNLTGSQDISILAVDKTNNTALTKIDGSAAAGKLNITASTNDSGITFITGGKQDTITLANVDDKASTIVINNGNSGVTNGTADKILNFQAKDSGDGHFVDKLAIGKGGVKTDLSNYKLSDAKVTSVEDAVGVANLYFKTQSGKGEQYFVVTNDGATNGTAVAAADTTLYVVVDYNGDGSADEAVQLVGGATAALTGFTSANIVSVDAV